MELHRTYLLQALTLAKLRRGFCAPNPAVGAVAVKENQVLATGYHIASGLPHAEADALAKLSENESAGASIYVTLEPCCHYGKTPPCTQLLINRGIQTVYYGFKDPNPVVAGKGEQALLQAGIACKYLPLSEIIDFYQSYQHWTRTKRPWVTAKLAMSLDGKIAGPQGQPIRITGTELQHYTHQQRKHSDAILTTAKTIVQDDPQLNVRLQEEIHAKPVYILDTNLMVPTTASVLKTAKCVTLFHQPEVELEQKNQLEKQGVRCIAVAKHENGLCLDRVLSVIGEEGIHDLWVEAGGTCFQALVAGGWVQKSLIYMAPDCLGENAQPAFADGENLFSRARCIEWQSVGRDVICRMDW